MDAHLRTWEGEELIVRRDEPTGAMIVLAIHDTTLGPGAGGARMKSYPDFDAAVTDALRLSAGMTVKNAIAGMPLGGAKTVIAIPDGLGAEDRAGLLRRFGRLVRQLGGRYYTGPDVGTTSDDMVLVAEAGRPYVFALPETHGGAGNSGPATALGVFSAMQAAHAHVFGTPSLAGVRVLVQGAGNVGGPLIERLLAAGAEVLVSDVDPAAISRWHLGRDLPLVRPEEVPGTPCTIYAPCALGGVLNESTIPRLRCAIVAGGANNQLATPADMDRLQARGITYVPDVLANAGGVTWIAGVEVLGWSVEEAERRVRGLAEQVTDVLRTAEREGISTDAAVRRLARAKLSPAALAGAPG